jgi:hypothetical protein
MLEVNRPRGHQASSVRGPIRAGPDLYDGTRLSSPGTSHPSLAGVLAFY